MEVVGEARRARKRGRLKVGPARRGWRVSITMRRDAEGLLVVCLRSDSSSGTGFPAQKRKSFTPGGLRRVSNERNRTFVGLFAAFGCQLYLPCRTDRTLALDIMSSSRGHPDCSSESSISVNGDTWSLESRSFDIKMRLCRFLFWLSLTEDIAEA
jgi:hypothetical protein